MQFMGALKAVRDVVRERPETYIVNEGANALDIARNVIDMHVPRHRLDSGTWGVMGIGMGFAVAAAVVVHSARELMLARRLADQLRTAMETRATIDQAIGILMSRQGGTAQDAFTTLSRLSQNQNIKLAVVAEELVREAVTRARARHGGGR